MKLPDPFMPNLKVDLLPDIKVSPRILSNYSQTLNQQSAKADLDQFFRTREHVILRNLLGKLRLPTEEADHAGTGFNVPLLSALVLYVGMHMPQGSHGLTPANPSLEIFIFLATELNAEGRYLFISSIANHLRYPNAYTHYFSCVLLYLFAETENGAVQEQITRVLLERLIVHRPHPWGLLITFIELIKNPRYRFWLHPFVTCAPEVEKLFQSVAHTCLGSGSEGAITAGAPPGRPGPPAR
jgi:CCR4-NOT transcription complex subunit 1